MSHNFSVKTASLFASLGVVAAFAVASPIKQAEAGDEKVDCSKLKDIKAFCESVDGKESAIKRVMKDAEKAYEKAGKGDVKCQTCHETANGGALVDEAKKLWPDYKPFVETAIKEYKK